MIGAWLFNAAVLDLICEAQHSGNTGKRGWIVLEVAIHCLRVA
jgi:hypothetical protein